MSNARFSILQGRAVDDKNLSDSQFRTLAALGKYTDNEGWCFPKQATLGEDRGLTRQTINAHIQALKDAGYLEVFPQYREDGSQRSNLYRLIFDFTGGVKETRQGVSNQHLTGGVKSAFDSNNDPLNDPSNQDEEIPVKSRQQRLLEERESQPDKKQGDLVDAFVAFSQTPAAARAARLEDVQYRIGKALNINPSWDRWERFVKFADQMEQDEGQTVEAFFRWLKAKPNFDIGFWPPDKMQEVWPQAFVADPTKPGVKYTPGKAFKG